MSTDTEPTSFAGVTEKIGNFAGDLTVHRPTGDIPVVHYY